MADLSELIRSWRNRWAGAYQTGIPEIDEVTNARIHAAEECADELERALAAQPAHDPVPLNAVRAAIEAVDTGQTQAARDNLRILEIHLRANTAQPAPDVWKEEAERLGTCIEIAIEKMREPVGYLEQALREHKNYLLTDGKSHG